VRHVAGWMLLPMLAPVALLGFCIFVVDVSTPLLVVATAMTVVIMMLSLRDMTTRLRIDADGVTFSPSHGKRSPVFVPWLSVREVVVVTGPTAAPQVGVRLRPGAPLPQGVRGMVHDPTRPDAVQPSLTRVVPGLDRSALAMAVQACGSRVVDAGTL
ncbi:MAG: hypothetical protein M4D85_09420, partial [Actinomycetota bacterium]|nr:hypothetical protein [Actinomycetota bacterium]